LNYFDGQYTSAAVEGINTKARAIAKRCYGVKSSDTLWKRLILDLNRAPEAVGRTVAELREIASGLKAVFLAFCTYNRKSLLRAVLTRPNISAESIFGAICAYLLIGLAWGTLYAVIEVTNPGSFQASSELADALRSTETRQSVLVYYSFVTLTTVGYGDITPLSPAARTLAWLEAMMGQFYIAVLVAFLVGIRVSQGPVQRSQGRAGENNA
jgi:voltage-gated potassium channel Kch